MSAVVAPAVAWNRYPRDKSFGAQRISRIESHCATAFHDVGTTTIRLLKRAGVAPGQPATQVVEDRETEITAELGHLIDGDDVDMLSLWRLAHMLAPPDFELLGEQVGTDEFTGINTAIARSF
jgi:hypothetical protein